MKITVEEIRQVLEKNLRVSVTNPDTSGISVSFDLSEMPISLCTDFDLLKEGKLYKVRILNVFTLSSGVSIQVFLYDIHGKLYSIAD